MLGEVFSHPGLLCALCGHDQFVLGGGLAECCRCGGQFAPGVDGQLAVVPESVLTVATRRQTGAVTLTEAGRQIAIGAARELAAAEAAGHGTGRHVFPD